MPSLFRARSRFSRDESRYSNHVGHGPLAHVLYAAHLQEGPPPHPRPPPGPSVVLTNAQPLSQIKRVFPDTDDTTRQHCWCFGPLKSHNHTPPLPTPPLMSLCLMLRFYQSTLCHSIMTNLFSLTSLTFATVILVPGAFDICSRDGCLASVLQNRESGVEKVAVKRDLPASFVSSGNCPVSSCARAPIRG